MTSFREDINKFSAQSSCFFHNTSCISHSPHTSVASPSALLLTAPTMMISLAQLICIVASLQQIFALDRHTFAAYKAVGSKYQLQVGDGHQRQVEYHHHHEQVDKMMGVMTSLNKRRAISSFLLSPISATSIYQRLDNKSVLSSQQHRRDVFVPMKVPRGGGGIQTTMKASHADIMTTSFFNNTPFLQYNAAIGIVNILGMLLSLLTGKQIHLDLLGTGAFALASSFVLFNAGGGLLASAEVPLRIQASSAAVILWSVKLASFLFYRACVVKSDARLDSMLSTTSGIGTPFQRSTTVLHCLYLMHV